MKKGLTIGEKYGPAMEITDPAAAAAYLEECIQETMAWGRSRSEAEDIERQNIGYYAGYYSFEVMARVHRLFGAVHPIFGTKEYTPKEALEMGQAMGQT